MTARGLCAHVRVLTPWVCVCVCVCVCVFGAGGWPVGCRCLWGSAAVLLARCGASTACLTSGHRFGPLGLPCGEPRTGWDAAHAKGRVRAALCELAVLGHVGLRQEILQKVGAQPLLGLGCGGPLCAAEQRLALATATVTTTTTTAAAAAAATTTAADGGSVMGTAGDPLAATHWKRRLDISSSSSCLASVPPDVLWLIGEAMPRAVARQQLSGDWVGRGAAAGGVLGRWLRGRPALGVIQSRAARLRLHRALVAQLQREATEAATARWQARTQWAPYYHEGDTASTGTPGLPAGLAHHVIDYHEHQRGRGGGGGLPPPSSSSSSTWDGPPWAWAWEAAAGDAAAEHHRITVQAKGVACGAGALAGASRSVMMRRRMGAAAQEYVVPEHWEDAADSYCPARPG
jgi:hypothetical protein